MVSALDIAILIPRTPGPKEDIMESTIQRAATLVGRAAGPVGKVNYVPAAYPLVLITNEILERRDIVRHGT
jgi:hypothetical protein